MKVWGCAVWHTNLIGNVAKEQKPRLHWGIFKSTLFSRVVHSVCLALPQHTTHWISSHSEPPHHPTSCHTRSSLFWPCHSALVRRRYNIKKKKKKKVTDHRTQRSSAVGEEALVLAGENGPVGRLADVSLLVGSEWSRSRKHRTGEDRGMWHQVFSGKTASSGNINKTHMHWQTDS